MFMSSLYFMSYVLKTNYSLIRSVSFVKGSGSESKKSENEFQPP